jgi:hypothetical protein
MIRRSLWLHAALAVVVTAIPRSIGADLYQERQAQTVPYLPGPQRFSRYLAR